MTRVLVATVFFIFLYIILFPTNILITDEMYYFRQALAYSEGEALLPTKHYLTGEKEFIVPGLYPPGLPIILVVFLSLGNSSLVFLTGLLSLLTGIFFTVKILENLELRPEFSLLIFWYFPAVLLSRTIMSDVPSLALVSIFLYLFTKKRPRRLSYLTAGLVASLSILFREPNILLALPFTLALLVKKRFETFLFVILGLVIGLVIRFGVINWAFGDFFFTKDPGMPFSLYYVGQNLLFYLPFLLLVIPAGLWSLFKYQGKFRIEIITSTVLFLLLYFSYSYTGIYFGGIKSIILGPRFFIPVLPLFIVCVAEYSKNSLRFINSLLLPVSLISIFLIQLVGYLYNKTQSNIWSNIHRNSDKIHLLAEYNNLPKLYYPKNTKTKLHFLDDNPDLDAILDQDTFFFLETVIRNDKQKHLQRFQQMNEKVFVVLKNYRHEEIYSGSLFDGTIIKQYKVYN
jgi:hypothetical protein